MNQLKACYTGILSSLMQAKWQKNVLCEFFVASEIFANYFTPRTDRRFRR